MRRMLRVILGVSLLTISVVLPVGSAQAESLPEYEATATPIAGCPTSHTDVSLTVTNNTVNPVYVTVWVFSSDYGNMFTLDGMSSYTTNTTAFMAPEGEFIIDIYDEEGGTLLETLYPAWSCEALDDEHPNRPVSPPTPTPGQGGKPSDLPEPSRRPVTPGGR